MPDVQVLPDPAVACAGAAQPLAVQWVDAGLGLAYGLLAAAPDSN